MDMEGWSLAVGILLMLVTAIGIVGYVALVIAIPVWRLLDWFDTSVPENRPVRLSNRGGSRVGLSFLRRVRHSLLRIGWPRKSAPPAATLTAPYDRSHDQLGCS